MVFNKQLRLGAQMIHKKLFSAGILAILLLTTFSVSLVSAFPNDVIREKTFVTYYGSGTGAGTDQYDVYAYDGIHWASGTTVTYTVNTKSAPTGSLNAVKAAFETWDAQIGDKLFNDNVAQASSNWVGNKHDGRNVVSWGRLGARIIAQTTVWYNPSTKEISEFGMVFSTAYKWGIDSDGELSGTVLVGKFDVQDIATHEAGHTLMLEDLYMDAASQLTMYGYGAYGQTYARSLGLGDINGIHAIYP